MARVSVIIPAYNESDMIDDCLQSLINQDYKDFKAIIVDDESTDDTASKIQSFAKSHPNRIEYRNYGKLGPGRIRNRVSHEVDSELLVFMDADCRATPQWLSLLVEVLDKRPEAASCGGPHLAPPESNAFQMRVEKFFGLVSVGIGFYKNEKGELRLTEHNPLCNVSYRRKKFLELNGFREDLWPGEDIELDIRLRKSGGLIYFQPKALVYHHRPNSIENFRKVMFAYGRAQGKMLRDRGLERFIQFFGLGVIFILFGLIVTGIAFDSILLLVAGILWALIFWTRPSSDGLLSICFNSLEWMNGFISGLRTGRSDPPGMKRPS